MKSKNGISSIDLFDRLCLFARWCAWSLLLLLNLQFLAVVVAGGYSFHRAFYTGISTARIVADEFRNEEAGIVATSGEIEFVFTLIRHEYDEAPENKENHALDDPFFAFIPDYGPGPPRTYLTSRRMFAQTWLERKGIFARAFSEGPNSGTMVLAAPWWVFSVALAFAPVITFRKWYRWRKRRRCGGHFCSKCDYDLRASKDRCPECGEPIAPPDLKQPVNRPSGL